MDLSAKPSFLVILHVPGPKFVLALDQSQCTGNVTRRPVSVKTESSYSPKSLSTGAKN